MEVKVLVSQLCLTLCGPMNCSSSGSFVYVIFQARILDWVAISFSRDLSNPGIKPMSPALAGGFFTSEPPGKLISPLGLWFIQLGTFQCATEFFSPIEMSYYISFSSAPTVSSMMSFSQAVHSRIFKDKSLNTIIQSHGN